MEIKPATRVAPQTIHWLVITPRSILILVGNPMIEGQSPGFLIHRSAGQIGLV